MGAVIFGPYSMSNSEYETTITIAVTYEVFSRVFWSFSIGWIVFACQFGYGGPINSILSAKIWTPFSRLTYSMYLLHFVVQIIIFGSSKTEISGSNFDAILMFWSSFGIILTSSLFFVLAFESPIIALEKIIFNTRNGNSEDAEVIELGKYNLKELYFWHLKMLNDKNEQINVIFF